MATLGRQELEGNPGYQMMKVTRRLACTDRRPVLSSGNASPFLLPACTHA